MRCGTYSDPLCTVERRGPTNSRSFRCEHPVTRFGLGWRGAARTRRLREEKRNANLIPHEPLAALYSQNRAEDAHGGTPAARTSGARVRNGDGLGAAGHGVGRIIGTLFALVAFLWIA